MKKIFVVLMGVVLSGCSYYMKGDYTLGKRNTFNDFFYTYNIRYYDEGEFSGSDTESVTESNYEVGVEKHAVPGGIVVSSKIYTRKVYTDKIVRPTMKGAMVSYTVPVEFSDEKVYKVVGETIIDEKKLRLIEPNRIGDVVLIDSEGKIYPRIGRIYNDRLSLLNTAFLLEPRELKFRNDFERSGGTDEEVSGYEIRYKGIEDYKIVFDYKTITPNGGNPMEKSKTYKFPMYDKEVTIDDVRLEILNVGDNGLDYKIVP